MTASSIPNEGDFLRIAWKRGLLQYKFHDGQKIINDKYTKSITFGKLFVANIARQFGKSYWAVVTAIITAIIIPKAVIKYGTAFLTDLEEFILPAFDKVFEDCPEDLKPKYNSKSSSFVFHNGSRIKLIGLDKKPNGLRGNTIDLIIIDECGFVGNLDYLYKSIIVPTTIHRPNARIIFISTPPESPDHPFSEYCQKAEAMGSYHHFTIYDNPMVSEHQIEELMKESGGEDSITWKREYLAMNVVDSNSAIIPEWKDDFVQEIQRDQFFPYHHYYEAMDLGVRDLTAVLYGYYDFTKAKFILEDELEMNGTTMTTVKLKDAIIKKEKELIQDKTVFRRISDNNNLILLQDLGTLHDLYFLPTTKDDLHAMVNEVRMFVNSGRLIINPKCKKTIGCLKYGIWDKKKKEFGRSSVYGHYDHLAALVYLVRNLDTVTNPVPPTYGMSKHTHIIVNTIPENNNANNIKKLFGKKF